MAFKAVDFSSRYSIEDLHHAVRAGSRKLSPIRAEGYRGEHARQFDAEQVAVPKALEVTPFPVAAVLGTLVQQGAHLHQIVGLPPGVCQGNVEVILE